MLASFCASALTIISLFVLFRVLYNQVNNQAVDQNDRNLLEYSLQTDKILQMDRNNSDSCAICLEENVPVSERFTLSCGHWFHKSCVRVWAAFGSTQSCPYCRVELSDEDVNQLGLRVSNAGSPSSPTDRRGQTALSQYIVGRIDILEIELGIESRDLAAATRLVSSVYARIAEQKHSFQELRTELRDIDSLLEENWELCSRRADTQTDVQNYMERTSLDSIENDASMRRLNLTAIHTFDTMEEYEKLEALVKECKELLSSLQEQANGEK